MTIEEFTSCSSNLAHNRQTRMLANLSLIHCYNLNAMSESTRNELMLKSAKENLVNLEFFGLTEHQRDTQNLFEETFNLQFLEDFLQNNVTHASQVDLSDHDLNQIRSKNSLDIELYEFAKDLFQQRVKMFNSKNIIESSTGVDK